MITLRGENGNINRLHEGEEETQNLKNRKIEKEGVGEERQLLKGRAQTLLWISGGAFLSAGRGGIREKDGNHVKVKLTKTKDRENL